MKTFQKATVKLSDVYVIENKNYQVFALSLLVVQTNTAFGYKSSCKYTSQQFIALSFVETYHYTICEWDYI